MKNLAICRFFRNFRSVNQTDMLPLQRQIQFSDYHDLYDVVVPKDNLLRKINDLIDFSFVRKELLDKWKIRA